MKKNRKRNKEKKEIKEKEITDKLENLERTVSELRDAITKIKESSFFSNEDQLFFSFVFSLALLAITIPSLDVTTLFESFGLKLNLTTPVVGTKVLVIASLLISSALRYRVSTLKQSSGNGNKLRALSVEFVILAFYWLMFELFFRGLATLLQQLNVFLLLIPPLALMSLSHYFGKSVERKWLEFYGDERNQLVSVSCFGVALFVLIAYILSMIVGMFVSISQFIALLLLFVSFALTAPIVRRYAKSI